MAKALWVLALLLVAVQADPSENLQPQSSESIASVAPDDADPADRTAALLGKKVELSISKEVVKQPLPLAPGWAPPATTAAPLLPSLLPLPKTPLAAHGHHHHHPHTTPAPPLPPVLHLDNHPIVIDNGTVTSLLQQLLAGNIKNVQAHGRPLVVPPGGKPVAVVFSAALHVVDIGNLLPAATPPKPIEHPAHAHPAPAPIDHTSILENLLQALHLLKNAKEDPIAATAIPLAPNAQPLIVMVPLPGAGAGGAPLTSPAAQLESLIVGLKKAKKQILAAKQQALLPALLPAAAVVTTALPPVIPLPAAAATEAPAVALPMIKKVKKVEISIAKSVG